MRAVVLSVVALAVSCVVAHAQEPSVPVDKAAVVAACVQQVTLPEGRTADAATITAYCQCAIDRTQAALTPAEFNAMGRVGLARSGVGTQPTPEELAALETPGFRGRADQGRAAMRADCNPILFGTSDPRPN